MSHNPQNTIKAVSKLSERTEYLKINLTPSEMKVFELEEKKLSDYFAQNGFVYNRIEHFRIYLLNFFNDGLKDESLRLYKFDSSDLFKREPKK